MCIRDSIHFTAHSELSFQINTRFNRKACSTHKAATVGCFQVVDVCSIPVILFMDRVPCTMNEILTISRSRYGLPGSIIDLPAKQRTTSCLLYTSDAADER